MAVVKQLDGTLDEFAREHESLGVLACAALDSDLDGAARQLVSLRRGLADGSLTPSQAFTRLAALDKELPPEVRTDVFSGLAG